MNGAGYLSTITLGNEISEEDIHVLHAANPLALHLLSDTEEDYTGDIGYTIIYLLCMKKKPNASLV
jgi:hypothetical protein